MDEEAFSLIELADASGIEPRTIRSYIERGLLPGAQSRGRRAAYLAEHLNRLRVIQAMRRARPNLSLSEIRIRLQELTPEQIRALAEGSITATVWNDPAKGHEEGEDVPEEDEAEPGASDRQTVRQSDSSTKAERFGPLAELTGPERLVEVLRQVTAFTARAPASKSETWHRIAVTGDIELSIRAEFTPAQVGAFRELADVLRHILTRPDAFPSESNE